MDLLNRDLLVNQQVRFNISTSMIQLAISIITFCFFFSIDTCFRSRSKSVYRLFISIQLHWRSLVSLTMDLSNVDSTAIANIVSGVINAALGLQNNGSGRDDGSPRAQQSCQQTTLQSTRQANSGLGRSTAGVNSSSRLED